MRWNSWKSALVMGAILSIAPFSVHAQEVPAVVPVEIVSLSGDADGDGLLDVWEEKVFGTKSQEKDTDKDGFDDKTEILQGFDPRKAGKATMVAKDADKDGLNDRLELLFGSDPLLADSDNDGYVDGEEIAKGFSPMDRSNVPLEKRIVISLSKQTMEQRLGGIALATFRVSTGRPGMRTPKGEFKVLNKSPRAWSKSAKLWMPYWMGITNRGHGIHELPEWPGGKKEGANHLGIPVSHGCVRLGVGAAKAMYDWAPVGTPVSIVN